MQEVLNHQVKRIVSDEYDPEIRPKMEELHINSENEGKQDTSIHKSNGEN